MSMDLEEKGVFALISSRFDDADVLLSKSPLEAFSAFKSIVESNAGMLFGCGVN